eukprot:7193492-Alexandrium_andersonii.AAC.1
MATRTPSRRSSIFAPIQTTEVPEVVLRQAMGVSPRGWPRGARWRTRGPGPGGSRPRRREGRRRRWQAGATAG